MTNPSDSIEQKVELEPQPTPRDVLSAGKEFLNHYLTEEIDPVGDHERFLDSLNQIGDPRYEGGRDLLRFELEQATDSHDWPQDEKDVINKTAEAMRMLETETPLSGNYDVIVALGGARMANLDRPKYAADAVKNGRASFDHMVVAGSARPLRPDEQPLAEKYGLSAAFTEFDLCDAAAKIVASENPDLSISSYTAGDEKANTPKVLANTFRKLRAEGKLPEGTRVAAVTTQIYQVSTSLDVKRVAKQFGLEAMAAGNPSDPELVAKRTPATYKSEILRTLKAAAMAAKAEAGQ